MKKLILLTITALLFSAQACSVELWEEGKHYNVISEQATDKPEILEFFSYWCPHCYNFEPLVAQIKQKMSDDVTFKKVHVNFMRFTSADVQDEATKALMIARFLDKEEEMNQAIFRNIHVQRAPVTGLKDLTNLFIVNGIDAAKVEKAAKSFSINSQLKKNNQLVKEYRRHVSGVPNFIVNGKYQAQFTKDMTSDDIVDLIVWLSEQK
ncbi:MAG: thiol:disulfide interchange protein DsbA/DsbL [Aestuariibacter sp.]